MKKIISLKDLSYSIPHSDCILQDINLEVSAGEFIGILGKNGAGKTTLMDLIMGFRKVTSGDVSVLEENPHSLSRSQKDQVVFLSQDVGIKGNISISEFLKFHASFYSNYSLDEENYLIKVFKLNRESKVGSLSTGQQKKVQIVAGLASKPKIILIDEITAVLDPETRSIFFQELQNIRKKFGTTVLLATNIAEDLVNLTDRVMFIDNKVSTIHSPAEISQLFNLKKVS